MNRFPKHRGRGRAGFTILELVIALALTIIVATLAVPAWFDREEVTLNNAVKLLAQDLRDAQDRAAYGHKAIEVRFFESGDGYRIVDASGQQMAAPVGGGPFERIYSRDAVFRGVSIAFVDMNGTRNLHFDDRGFALEEGAVHVHYKNGTRVLRIHSYTGLIEIDGLGEPCIDRGQ
jgi:type II secretory pathway pseudopilin PulG